MSQTLPPRTTSFKSVVYRFSQPSLGRSWFHQQFFLSLPTPTLLPRLKFGYLPEWIEVQQATSQPDAVLAILDPGERDAILLAQEKHADLLLIDERRGRKEAKRRGLSTTGTLGVLLAGEQKGLIDAGAIYELLLTKTNFRSTPELRSAFLRGIRSLGKKRT